MSDKDISIRILATNETGAATAQAASDIQRLQHNVRATGEAVRNTGNVFGELQQTITRLLGAYMGMSSIKAFVSMSDEAALAAARMEQVTGSAEKAAEAQKALYDMAQRLQAPVREVQQVFTRLMPAVEQLKGGAREAAALSEIVITTAKIAGASASEAAASAQQFAQALGSGVLQGDELKSILENNQELARTLSGALGVTIGELRKMGEEGKLTADVVGNALLGQFDAIKAKGAELPTTVGGAFTKVSNAVYALVAALDASNGPLRHVIDVFDAMAQVIDLVCENLRMGQSEADQLGARKETVHALGRAFAWVVDVVSALIGQIKAAGQAMGGLFAAANAAMQGNFGGAAEIIKDMHGKSVDALANMMGALAGDGAIVRAHAERAAQAAGAGNSDKPTQFAKLQGSASGKEKKGAGGGRKGGGAESNNLMGQWQQQLDAMRLTYEEEQRMQGSHQQLSRAAERAFWQDKLRLVNASSKEGLEIRQKINATERAIWREQAQAAMRASEAGRNQKLHDVAMQAQAANQLLETGHITQQQHLLMQQQFEQERFAIAAQALQERLALAEQEHNVADIERLHEQKLELERQFQHKLAALRHQQQMEQDKPARNVAKGMQNALAQSFQGMLTRTMTFRQTMQNIFKSIGGVFLQEMVTKPLADLLTRKAQESSIWQAIFGQQVAGQETASTTTTSIKAQETVTNVTKDAKQAGAGAAKALAGIPVVGPGLAAAAMPAMIALVMGLIGGGGGGGSSTSTSITRIPSAAGGWDIPAGLNPLTQLHEREMVLPAQQADVIRQMADDGNTASTTPIVIHTSGGDFVHKRDLAKLLRTMRRDYRFA